MDETPADDEKKELQPEFDFEEYDAEVEVEEEAGEVQEVKLPTIEGLDEIEDDIPEMPDIPEGSTISPAAAAAAEEAESVEAPAEETATGAAPLDAPATPGELQVTLVVEAGRVHVPLDQLLQMSEGNTLDLDVHPEKGVDLVVDGQCVGRGELVKIGDHLGVRILDMG